MVSDSLSSGLDSQLSLFHIKREGGGRGIFVLRLDPLLSSIFFVYLNAQNCHLLGILKMFRIIRIAVI